MLDFTPDFVEILGGARSAIHHKVSHGQTMRQCIRSLTCKPHKKAMHMTLEFREFYRHHWQTVKLALLRMPSRVCTLKAMANGGIVEGECRG